MEVSGFYVLPSNQIYREYNIFPMCNHQIQT